LNTLDKARETQLKNIQLKTEKSFEELKAFISQSGLKKHGELRKLLMEEFNLGFGDASMLVHFALQSDGQSAAEASNATLEELITEIYSGPKAIFRPLHDHLMSIINNFGPFEIKPKKGYLSLRRKRQFLMIGPATNTRFELGLNVKNLEPDDRLQAQSGGSMCNYKVIVNAISEVDLQLIEWLKMAFESAG
jgi:hypothetical protein